MPPLHTVVCAIDFTEGSDRALIRAADLAERSHTDLHLIHVTPLFRARLAQSPGGDIEAHFRARTEAYVNDILGSDDAFSVLAPQVHQTHGETPADGILHYAEATGADLIVVGTHARRGLGHLLLGSVAAETLRRSDVPVLTVPERAAQTAPGPKRPVLVAVDFSTMTPLALNAACDLAETYGASIELVHVLEGTAETPIDLGGLFTLSDLPSEPGESPRAVAHQALRRLAESVEPPVTVRERHVTTGTAEAEIVRLAKERRAGAVVMGTHGRSGWDRLRLGSVAEWAVRHAACPVLTVRSPYGVTPDEAASERAPEAQASGEVV